MKALMPSLLLAASLFAALPAGAQKTQMLTADKHNEYGLVYTLPVTAIRFDITARHTVGHAGPYYQYAKKFAGTDQVVKEDFDAWEILSVRATPYGVPDKENSFLMQVKAGAMTSICVDENGMLLAINKEVTAPAAVQAEPDTRLKADVGVRDYQKFVNEDFVASQSSAKQAQMLSESLMEVRDARVSLTRGTAETMPSDGRQLELMLNSLAQQEAAYMAAFTGAVESQTVTRTFTFLPEDAGRSILFRMSDFAGFVDADDYSGEPVYIDIEITHKPELPVDAKGKEKELPKDAVIYNLPGAAKVTLTLAGRTLWQGDVEFSQFGTQFGLQPSLFSDKKGRSFATFDPATGALTEIAEINGD